MKQLLTWDAMKAGKINVAVKGIVILVHLLVILRIIPFSWISGGMIEDFNSAASVAFSSIVLLATMGAITYIIANEKSKGKGKMWMQFAVLGMMGIMILSFLLQLLGTPFEKAVMSIVCLVDIYAYIQLFRAKSE